jgi:hypothetical protein
MKSRRLGRIRLSDLFFEELGSNIDMMRAYSKATSHLFVVSCTYDIVNEWFEQIVCDPHGLKLPEVKEGDKIPDLKVYVTKMRPVSLDDPTYTCSVTIA